MNIEEFNKKLFTTKFIKQRQFWLQKYEELDTSVFLNFDPLDKVEKAGGWSRMNLNIPTELSEKILKISNSKDLSVFVIFYSLLTLLVEKQARKDFSNIVTPIFKDNKTEDTVNKYVNLVLKNEQEQTYKERLVRAGKLVVDSYNNQDYPQQIIEEFIMKQSNASEFPTSNVGISYAPIHEEWDESIKENRCIFHFDKEGAEVTGEILFDPNIYPEIYVKYLAPRFVHLASQCLMNLELELNQIVLIPDEEKKFLIDTLNQTKVEYDTSKTFLDHFQEQVSKHPNKVVVQFGDTTWTYSELNQKSNGIAHYLTERKIENEAKIILMMERSEWMMAAILGIWKAGAVYIPVDVNFPEARITEIISDSNAQLILSSSNEDLRSLRDANITKYQTLVLQELDFNTDFDTSNFRVVTPDNLAYVIYTSGSTGKPKGAQIEHKGMLNHLFLKVNSLEMDLHTRLAQNSPHTFDVSVWQYFASTMVGGTAIVYSNEMVLDPEFILEKMIEDQITIFELVPSYLSVLLEAIENNNISLNYLKYLIVNGETVKPVLINRWFDTHDKIKLINAYGPTEASDDVTQHEMTSHFGQGIVPIGKTVQNMAIYLVDEEMNLVPYGEKGEITVAGIGVGRGYLNNEEKTKKVFIANPFDSQHPKMYKTNDIGKYDKDGNLLCFGRMDSQVKIRGFRIELGEIEHKLATIDVVKDAILTTVENNETKQLVAFIIMENEQVCDEKLIKSKLGELLPDYMVPSFIVPLEEYPLSSNGKVDRKKLPIDQIHRKPVGENTSSNSIESSLINIFEEVLNIGGISVNDNFFSLGGHSVAAIQVVSRVKKYLQVDLPLVLVFKHPTILELSAIVSEALDSGEDIGYLINIPKHEKRSEYSIAPVQYPEWYMQKLNPGSTFYNVGFLIDFNGELNVDHFLNALNIIFRRHDSLNLYFKELDGKPVFMYDADHEWKKENVFVDFSDKEDSKMYVDEFLKSHYNQVLNLESQPITNVKLIQSKEAEFLFLFETHHIVWDQTSSFIFARELEQAYNSLINNQPVELPDLPVNYMDYSSWMNGLLQDGKLEKERKYWLNKFENIPAYLELPMDRPRPLIQSFNGAYVYEEVSLDFKKKLGVYCKENDTTLQILLLSVFNFLLFKLTGQDDFVVGTPILNRDHEDLENVIGLFASALPIRIENIDPNDTFQALHDKTKQGSLEAYENRMYPFNQIIEELDIPMDFARSKIISVFFGVQNDESDFNAFQLEGLKVNDHLLDASLQAESTSVFDLTMQIDQSADYMSFSIRYNSDLFDPSTMEQFMNRYIDLVDQCVENSALTLSEYSIIDNQEKELINDCLKGRAVPLNATTVLDLFEEQARINSDKVAIEESNTSYTFDQLNQKAEEVAAFLIHNGVEEQRNVGVLIPRSFKQIATVLGIMKANCVYVPLSLDYPIERIESINQDADLSFVIIDQERDTDGKMLESVNWLSHETITNADLNSAATSRKPKASDLVYILFTSGSTGKPKGIAINHGNFVNVLEGTQDLFEMKPGKKALYATSFVFDASLLEYLWPLAYGATSVVYSENNDKSMLQLGTCLKEKKIHFMQFVPLLLEEFLGAIKHNDLDSQFELELIFVGGAILPKRISSLFESILNCKLYNCYGPTEITIDAARFDCKNEFEGDIVPIGKPIQNTQLFVFDSAHNVCPIGVKGELYIASAGTSQGYLNAPKKNKQHFISSSKQQSFGEGLYKTGDIAYYNKEGNIVVIGRNDLQVKVNGNRVELEELEHRMIENVKVAKSLFSVKKASMSSDLLLSYVELDKSMNGFETENDSFRLLTADQNPGLQKEFDILHAMAWPEYFEGSEVVQKEWPKIYEMFPQYQYALCSEENDVVAVGNAVPILWDGSKENLPEGWDGAVQQAVNSTDNPNTLVILAGILHPDFQGKGLSKYILDCFHQLKTSFDFDHLIVALRPVGKTNYQDVPLEKYILQKDKNNLSEDAWLRTHEKAGGKILKAELHSQKVTGTVAQWEKWSEVSFESSGEYLVKDALAEMTLDIESGMGTYFDPCVWLDHSSFKSKNEWHHVSVDKLRSHLIKTVPSYMVPNFVTITASFPILESGKIDRGSFLHKMNALDNQTRVAPENILQNQLLTAFSKITNNDNLGIHDDFFTYGGHSINVLRLIAEIKQLLDIELKVVDIFQNSTVKKLACLIEDSNRGNAEGLSCFQTLSSGKSKNLICIPSLSALPFEFQALSEKLTDYNVLVLDLGILNNYSNVKVSVANITAYCVEQILNLGTSMPTSILGYSTGGVFGYELVRELEKQNVFMQNFFVVDTAPRQTIKRATKLENEQLFEQIKQFAAGYLPNDLEIENNKELLATIKRYMELDGAIVNEGKIAAPVTILYNENVCEKDYEEWGELTQGQLKFQKLSGDHFTILNKENIVKNEKEWESLLMN